MDRIIVRTNWTNAVSERREFALDRQLGIGDSINTYTSQGKY
jgi:hypothetical protein